MDKKDTKSNKKLSLRCRIGWHKWNEEVGFKICRDCMKTKTVREKRKG